VTVSAINLMRRPSAEEGPSLIISAHPVQFSLRWTAFSASLTFDVAFGRNRLGPFLHGQNWQHDPRIFAYPAVPLADLAAKNLTRVNPFFFF